MLVGIEIVDRASHQMARKYRFLLLKLILSEIGFSALSANQHHSEMKSYYHVHNTIFYLFHARMGRSEETETF